MNREPGAEARRVLDRELGRLGSSRTLSGYGSRATGHLQVASAIAAGLADAGVASEPAALAYGMAFLPLAAERFDLVIPAAQAGSREVQGLLKVLSSPWLLAQLGSLPGYDASRCGEHVASLILDRADRDLEGTADPRALVAGMSQVVADVRIDLLELAPDELGPPGQGPALPGLLDRHAALADFLHEYAFVEDTG